MHSSACWAGTWLTGARGWRPDLLPRSGIGLGRAWQCGTRLRAARRAIGVRGVRGVALNRGMADVGRNERCPCGSGLRYKSCHGRLAEASRKVDFVVAGTQKGGTSTLAAYLDEHLDVCMPTVKEVHFFDKDQYFGAQVDDYTFYQSHFDAGQALRVVGDATPTYMHSESAPQRIARYNPAMKFIMLLREPGERAYSHWNMQVKKQRETLSFEDAIRGEADRLGATAPERRGRWSYVDRGRYSAQLLRVWQHFPREQTLVLRSDDFKSDEAAVLARVASFLGIGQFPRVDGRRVFEMPYEQPMSTAARDFLRATFAAEIDQLARLLDWDLDDWRSRR